MTVEISFTAHADARLLNVRLDTQKSESKIGLLSNG